MAADRKLNGVRGLVVDIDGTLFRGPRLMPGAREFFSFLETRGISYVVATNNTRSGATYSRRFREAGISLGEEHILTCAGATADYLGKNYPPGARVYVIGKEDLREEISARGFALLSGMEEPADLVVVGGDFDLTYRKLKEAVLHIQGGARLIGTNPDLLIPTEEGLIPEAGTTLAALEAATGIRPVIIGKPEHILFDLALDKMGVTPEEAAMLGDRLETDILGGRQAGLMTILVETGVDSRRTAAMKGIHPDLTVKSLRDLIALWEEQK